MKGIQIKRHWGVIKLLEDRKHGLSVAEIASHLDANQQTVYRTIDDLAIAGFPLYSEQVDGGNQWKLIEGSKSKLPLPVTMTELMALHMSRDILKVFKGTIFEESIESFFDKVTLTCHRRRSVISTNQRCAQTDLVPRSMSNHAPVQLSNFLLPCTVSLESDC